MLSNIIKQMKQDLSEHTRPKETLFEHYVQKRLDASLACYYEEIQESMNSLRTKASLGSIKRIMKKL